MLMHTAALSLVKVLLENRKGEVRRWGCTDVLVVY